MENEKLLRYAAAMFALNPSAAFCRMQKARTKLGNLECNVSFVQTLRKIFLTKEGIVLCNRITTCSNIHCGLPQKQIRKLALTTR